VSETSSVIVLEAMGWLAAIIAPMEAIRRVLRDTIAGGPKRLWQRWLAGRPGRWFFQSASIGQHAPQLPAEEPTVMALGRATEAAFAALPPGQQRQLAQLPEVVARLQADVLQLRAGPAGGDGRVAIAVGALENLRMDLLRLAAGEGVGEGLTQDIEAAQRIGEDIRALLHATDPKA
jgi:hypothetical protein